MGERYEQGGDDIWDTKGRCHVGDDGGEHLRILNAHADLVAALRFVGIELSQRGYVQSAMMDRINAALAKAEGAK